MIAFRCDQDCSPLFLMSRERSDHPSAGSLLDFVFLHETVCGAAWFGVCAQEHAVPIVVKVQGPFKVGVLSTSCRRHVDRRLVLPLCATRLSTRSEYFDNSHCHCVGTDNMKFI